MLRSPFGVRSGARAFLCLPRADRGDALGVRHFEAFRARVVVEVGDRHPREPPADRALDPA
jgi:hypothetical protein